jgi:hypothetical protein
VKELLQELLKDESVLGSFYFKEDENIVSFTDEYKVPESRIKRIALVLTQTMDALGGGTFDRFLLEGEDKRVSIYKHNGGYFGVVFKSVNSFDNIEKIFNKTITEMAPPEIKEVEVKKPEEKPVEKPKEEPKEEKKPAEAVPTKKEIILSPQVFEKIKGVLDNYLGDFSETVFENQMSDMNIDVQSAPLSKVRKMCFSLQKASAMLIGPSFAREMVDKLLNILKDEQDANK